MPAPYRNVEKCKEYIHCMSNFFLSDEHKNEAMQQQREIIIDTLFNVNESCRMSNGRAL